MDYKAITSYGHLLIPEVILIGTIILLVLCDLLIGKKISRRFFGWLSLLATLSALVACIQTWIQWQQIKTTLGASAIRFLEDTYLLDSFSIGMKCLILFSTAFVFLLSLGAKNDAFALYEAEYHYLLLAGVLGGIVMVSSGDLITLFVGLELLSLSSYVLVGIRKTNIHSAEGAWKYVVLGGVASAFILYGMSFLYGMTGSTSLIGINGVIDQIIQSPGTGQSALLYIYLSLFLMTLGFGFKIAAAPFHTWTPDVYQGAHTPITAFLATVTKIAAFGLILRVLLYAYLPIWKNGDWHLYVQPILIVLAICSMIIGNLLALKQTQAKRLMAYSGIAQIGYILVPLAMLQISQGDLFIRATFFYFIAYIVMSMGAFAIISYVSEQAGHEDVSAFAGLYKRSPILAAAMSIFLISLAGFPITAGFIGKFVILSSVIGSVKGIFVAVTMILTTIISYYYYFRFIRQMYFRKVEAKTTFYTPWPLRITIALSLIGTIGLAVVPNLLLQMIEKIQW